MRPHILKKDNATVGYSTKEEALAQQRDREGYEYSIRNAWEYRLPEARGGGRPIYGNSLIESIEHNFEDIIKGAEISGASGYKLSSVTLIDNGDGTAILSIEAWPWSDALVGIEDHPYTADTIRQKAITISGVEESDIPGGKYDFEIGKKNANTAMPIRGAWNIPQLPTQYIIEDESGQLRSFSITPMQRISESDLKSYGGYHPRRCKGQPMPEYLYKFYGLEKSDESGMTERLYVRMTPDQKAKLESAGPISDVIRKLIDEME